MNQEQAYGLRIASDPHVSGDSVYYTLTWIEGDEYRSSIYRLNSGKQERMTFGGHEKKPFFKNGSLYYVFSDHEEECLMKIEENKEPVKLFTSKSVSKYVFHDKGILAIVQDKVDTKKPFATENVRYRFDGYGLFRSRKKLVLIGKENRDLVSGDFDVTDVSTNGKRIIFSSTKEDDKTGSEDVYELDLSTIESRRITSGKGMASPVLVTESGQIAYIGHRRGKVPWAPTKLIFPETGKEVEIGKSASNSVGSDLFVPGSNSLIYDSGSYYMIGQVGASSYVFKYDGSVTKVTGEGISVRSFDISNGKIAVVFTSPIKPSVLRFGIDVDMNEGISGFPPQRFEVNGQEAWIMLSGKENPTVVAVHGGPHTAYGNAYSIEFNYLVSNGFNVLYGNPRGSDGYGEEFASQVAGDWGGKDFEDILSFMEEAKKRFDISENFAITGGSYGGFMTNNAITKTNRFKAAISERSVSNLLSMCGTSDIGFWFNAIESGIEDPWSPEGMRVLMEMSPISRAKNVKTPTLFVHGEEDYRCPIEQSEQMYTAIRLNGVEASLARYPGDSHEHARRGVPANMKDRLERKLNWFSKYCKQ